MLPERLDSSEYWERHGYQKKFVFSLQFCEKVRILLDGVKIPTKREMPQLVMSLYDPLELLGSFVIHGEILIQEVERTDTD